RADRWQAAIQPDAGAGEVHDLPVPRVDSGWDCEASRYREGVSGVRPAEGHSGAVGFAIGDAGSGIRSDPGSRTPDHGTQNTIFAASWISRGRLFWLVTFPKFAFVGSVFASL